MFKILIVDDSAADREAYIRFLRQDTDHDYVYFEAESGMEGIQFYKAERPDCVLLDYLLPDIDGAQVVTELRRLEEHVPIVILTGHGSDQVAKDTMAKGAQDYLVKGVITASAMRRVVNNTIERIQLFRKITDQNKELKKEIEERIDAQKKLQAYTKELEIARDIAQEASREKSNFLANMSHEIRTPMNGVIGMTELMLNTQLTEKQMKYAKTIYNSGEVLLGIINNILDFSKIEAGELKLLSETVVLNDIAKASVELMTPNAEKNKNILKLEYNPDQPYKVMSDSLRLSQVFNNLIGNAVKFTKDGTVTVRISEVSRQRDQVTVLFEFIDTGVGIAADKMDKMFGHFVQAEMSTTKTFGGTGLGLAICQRLVGLMGSVIKIDSELGKGSRFYFELTLPTA
ncbi:MAG: response regulator [Alphaproteobacteria bacterium]|nr:response regulator [Alphaproteobacteria bacterium]